MSKPTSIIQPIPFHNTEVVVGDKCFTITEDYPSDWQRQVVVEELAQRQATQELHEQTSTLGPVSVLLNTFDLMERFLTVCRGRGCRPTTVASYRSLLRPFARHFHGNLPLASEVIGAYLAGLKRDTTRKQVWKVLNNFYVFVCAAEKVPDPMPAVARPKVKPEEKPYLTLEEAGRLMKACQNDRERALIDCYLNEALRLSEALRLDIPDIDDEILWINGKERGEPQPLLSEVRASLLKVTNGRTEGPVFTNYKGGRLGRSTAAKTVRGLFRRAGITKRVTPHSLRHTFKSLAIKYHCNQYLADRLLRQVSQGGNATYNHAEADDLKNALERFAPVRLLKAAERGVAFSSRKTDHRLPLDSEICTGDPTALIPELLDRLAALGDLAKQVSRALGGNGHRVGELANLGSLTGRFAALHKVSLPSQAPSATPGQNAQGGGR